MRKVKQAVNRHFIEGKASQHSGYELLQYSMGKCLTRQIGKKFSLRYQC